MAAPEPRQYAEYESALREAANGPCARKAMLRLGFGDNCMHCLAVQRLHAEELPEPTLINLVQELRRTIGLFDGAMAITPKQAWEEALERIRLLKSGACWRCMEKDHDCFLMNCHDRLERAEAFAKRMDAENIRLRAALNKLAEDAEVAAQGGLHSDQFDGGE